MYRAERTSATPPCAIDGLAHTEGAGDGIRMRPCLRHVALLLLVLGAARADRIQFTHGGELEGVIIGETTNEVTLKMGPGSATFRKNTLRAIHRDADANTSLRGEWQEVHFAEDEFVPPELRPLAAQFRALRGLRDAASRAQAILARDEAAVERIATEAPDLLQRSAEIVISLQRVKPEQDPAGYNALARTNNAIVARLAEMGLQKRALETQMQTNRATVNGYLHSLAAFREAFEEPAIRRATGGQARIFLEKAGAELAAMQASLQEVRIRMDPRQRDHAFALVRINDRFDAKLLVDTGASYVSLSAATAARINVTGDRRNPVRLKLADGRETEGYPLTLDTMRIGEAVIHKVPAIVMPDVSHEAIDGLLGMSFLRHFDVRLDPVRGELQLRKLRTAR